MDYDPPNLAPCFSVRSRREVQTYDSVNARLVEHWQTDAPQTQFSRRDISGAAFWMDMNATPSRLYREDLRQSQPYVAPSNTSPQVKKTIELGDQANTQLTLIENIKFALTKDPSSQILRKQLADAQSQYRVLTMAQKQVQIDTLANNPYFDKYDVASDSRNIVREMRSVVHEDVVDRGVKESKLLLRREVESRWLPANYAEVQGIDTLSAYELMRPKTNDMTRTYR